MSEMDLLKVAVEQMVDRRFNERFSQLLGLDPTPNKPSRPAATRWTEDQKKAIVADALSGMSMSQMARKYGRTQGAIRLRLYGKKAGLLRKHHFSQVQS